MTVIQRIFSHIFLHRSLSRVCCYKMVGNDHHEQKDSHEVGKNGELHVIDHFYGCFWRFLKCFCLKNFVKYAIQSKINIRFFYLLLKFMKRIEGKMEENKSRKQNMCIKQLTFFDKKRENSNRNRKKQILRLTETWT